MADALADLLYVVYGAGVTFGIDLDPIFDEVHRSNMTKLWPDGKVHYRADGNSDKREAEARVRKNFDEMSVYGSKEAMHGRPRATLEEIKDFGRADSREAALALYERACKAAEKKGDGWATAERAGQEERKKG